MRIPKQFHRPVSMLLLLPWLSIAAYAHGHDAYSHDPQPKTSNPDWMAAIKDDTLISMLSIPGTHETMALYGVVPLPPGLPPVFPPLDFANDMVICQSMSLESQLISGVRVLDIRCRHINDVFLIFHGKFFQLAGFDDVLNTVASFLEAHPCETVLMRVKEEDNPVDTTRTFKETFRNYWDSGNWNFWRPSTSSNPDNPKLGELRGKIVVLQDFDRSAEVQEFGIRYASIDYQDQFALETYGELYDKWLAVKAHLEKANGGDEETKYINYLSAATKGDSFPIPFVFPYFVASGHISPGTSASRLATGYTAGIAGTCSGCYPDFPRVTCFLGTCTIAYEGTNILTHDRLGTPGYETRVGMLMADFPGPGLIEKTIRLNDRLRRVLSITCPANLTVGTNSGCSYVGSIGQATVTDNCDMSVTVTNNAPASFPKGTTTVTWTATDDDNNQTTCTQTVTVVDDDAPGITCPANISVPAATGSCSAMVTYAAPAVSDNCPGVGAPTCSPASGATFPKGTTTVNCSVSDAAGNTKACSFTVTVVDTQAPSIVCPANRITNTINPGDATVAVNFAAPVANDNCPGVSVACVPPSNSQFPKGTTTVTCTATDAAGNRTACSFTIKIFDYVIVDDTNGRILRFISTTGEYDFFDCRKGTSLSGQGQVTLTSCKAELRDLGANPKSPDRNVLASANYCIKAGSATVSFAGVTSTLNDANLSNNINRCP